MADISLSTRSFDSGKFGTAFAAVATEASVSHLFEFSDVIGGDNTAARMSCYVSYIQMSCNSAGRPHLRDGSSGTSIVASQPPSDVTIPQGYSQAWDFRDDPLVCLTADGTSVLAVDMTVAGAYAGFVKYHFGPSPTA